MVKKLAVLVMVTILTTSMIGCSRQADNQSSEQALEQQAALIQQEVQTTADSLAARAQQQVQEVTNVTEKMADTIEQVQAAIPGQDQIQQWVAQAEELLKGQKYEEAMKIAQDILAKNPASTEAQSIFERAKAAIQKLAQEKMQKMGSGELSNAMEGLKKLPSLGQ